MGNCSGVPGHHQWRIGKQARAQLAHRRRQGKETRRGALLEAGQVRTIAARLPGQSPGAGNEVRLIATTQALDTDNRNPVEDFFFGRCGAKFFPERL
jgi:hypothetical protein